MSVVRERKARRIWEELEKGFGSGAKFRILMHLILNQKEAFTGYNLVKVTGLRTPAVANQLRLLLNLGWIKEDTKSHFSSMSYRINLENDFVKHVASFADPLKSIL
jgi:Fic family protein